MKASTISYFLVLSFCVTFSTSLCAQGIVGPTQVCPKGTYVYTVGVPPGAINANWYASYTGFLDTPFSSGAVNSNGQFQLNLNVPGGGDIGPVYIRVRIGYLLAPSEDRFLQINRTLPVPAKPNSGLVIVCQANEEIPLSSSPYIPYLGYSDITSCFFHCNYEWNAPSGWEFLFGITAAAPNRVVAGETTTIRSSSNFISGNNGYINVIAYFKGSDMYSGCGYNVNTSNSSSIWGGIPTISSPTVNGGPSQVPNYINGSAFLVIDSPGATSINWSIDGGSGNIQPNFNSCNASTSNFVRVRVTTTNRCGQGQSHTFYLQDSGYSGYTIYPNPAKSSLKVEFDEGKYAEDLVQSVKLFTEDGKEVKSFDVELAKTTKYFAEKKYIEFDVSKLKRGKYFLQLKIGGHLKASQIELN